jgi:hypothetical protein
MVPRKPLVQRNKAFNYSEIIIKQLSLFANDRFFPKYDQTRKLMH